ISAPRCFLPATPTPQISTLSLHDALPISYQVNAQADMRFRLSPDDILRLKVRNAEGEMVPLGAFVTLDETAGPDRVMHYNGYVRSEEHTSELQSRENLVCRLLLEKKKKHT